MQEKRKTPQIRFKGFTDDWEQYKLGELGETYTGLSGKTKKDFGHGNAKFITYMNVFTNSISDISMVEPIEIDNRQTKIQIGDVFFTTSSETPEEVGLSSVLLEKQGVMYLNSFCFGYRPNRKIDEFYLAYMLRSKKVRNDIILLAQGISRYNISKLKMMDIKVPIPNLIEQNEIGKYLYKLDTLITLHQRKCKKLKMLKKSMLEKMFPKNDEKVPEIRFKGFTDDWEQCQALEIFKSISNKNYPELPVLSATQEYGMIKREETGIDIFHDKGNEKTYKKVNAGQFVIHLRSFQGGFAHSEIDGITSPAYTVLDFIKPNRNYDYFWKYIFNSDEFINRLKTVTYGIRDGRSISYIEFLSMKFIYPIRKEQIKIASFLKSIDESTTLHQRKVDKLKEIKKSMLERMFV